MRLVNDGVNKFLVRFYELCIFCVRLDLQMIVHQSNLFVLQEAFTNVRCVFTERYEYKTYQHAAPYYHH